MFVFIFPIITIYTEPDPELLEAALFFVATLGLGVGNESLFDEGRVGLGTRLRLRVVVEQDVNAVVDHEAFAPVLDLEVGHECFEFEHGLVPFFVEFG